MLLILLNYLAQVILSQSVPKRALDGTQKIRVGWWDFNYSALGAALPSAPLKPSGRGRGGWCGCDGWSYKSKFIRIKIPALQSRPALNDNGVSLAETPLKIWSNNATKPCLRPPATTILFHLFEKRRTETGNLFPPVKHPKNWKAPSHLCRGFSSPLPFTSPSKGREPQEWNKISKYSCHGKPDARMLLLMVKYTSSAPLKPAIKT